MTVHLEHSNVPVTERTHHPLQARPSGGQRNSSTICDPGGTEDVLSQELQVAATGHGARRAYWPALIHKQNYSESTYNE